MNKTTTKILSALLIAYIVCSGIVIQTTASSAKSVDKKETKQLTALTNEMHNFEYYLLMKNSYDNTYLKKTSIKLNNTNIAKAAALTAPETDKNCVKNTENEEGGEDCYYSVSDDELKKASQKIFGKKATKVMLPSEKDKNSIYDVYNSKEYGPVKYISIVETETTFTTNYVTITKKGSDYVIVKEAYFGYWGGDHGNSNLRIIYTAQKSNKSGYGFIIKKMSIQTYSKTISFSVDKYAQIPFYGIWVASAKSEKQAAKKAMELYKKGLEAQILITSDWSNLNKEKWYVVTSGECTDEATAFINLDKVKKYYPSAYVKYSGEWRGK